jgi:hypothetical protein
MKSNNARWAIITGAFAMLLNPIHAQLWVTAGAPKLTGKKVVVPLALENRFATSLESGRAILFLLGPDGKVLGRETRWVIGGSEGRTGLAAGATNLFHFVVNTAQPLVDTNFTTKVTFTRLVLEGGQTADAEREVVVKGP